MSHKIYSNIGEWMNAHDNQIFRMWRYKRTFTSCAQERKFQDESPFENDHCEYVVIKEIIPISETKIMIGVTYADNDYNLQDGSTSPYISYYSLDEIRLDLNPEDSIE